MMDRLLVLAPHPDDEILGAGGLMAAHQAAGGALAVAILTDGAASDPSAEPARLAVRRQYECRHGLELMLDSPPDLLFVGVPDGALGALRPDSPAYCRLASFVDAFRPTHVVTTDPADGHPDHKAAFGIAAWLASSHPARALSVVPVGQRIDGEPVAPSYRLLPVGDFRQRKARAIDAHQSQLSGDGFRLPADAVMDFVREEQVAPVHDPSEPGAGAIPPAHFDRLYTESADPWNYDSAPYEQARMGRIIAALGERRYMHALEIGCGPGALTARLARHCQRITAIDASPVALVHARQRLGPVDHVALVQAELPGGVPDGPFDLIVASDILYYLGLPGLRVLLDQLARVTRPGARLIVANYLGRTDTPLTGEMASETALFALAGWRRHAALRDPPLRIDVLDHPDAG